MGRIKDFMHDKVYALLDIHARTPRPSFIDALDEVYDDADDQFDDFRMMVKGWIEADEENEDYATLVAWMNHTPTYTQTTLDYYGWVEADEQKEDCATLVAWMNHTPTYTQTTLDNYFVE